ncbi:MAG: phosphate acetyltransferase [Comamonas sp.]
MLGNALLRGLFERAAQQRRRIVLCEGDDERVAAAGALAQQAGVADIVLISTRRTESTSPSGPQRLHPDDLPAAEAEALAQALFELRRHKGLTLEQARQQVREPLLLAHLLVATGRADGCVSGAVHTTADVVRAAIQIIGKHPQASLVSSFFLMITRPGALAGASDEPHGLIFTDCGLVVNPSAPELVEIARAGAQSARQLLGEEPRLAMLSFSTNGSANHQLVDKVREATALLHASDPALKVDGEVQLDAALVPDIARRKVKDSAVGGHANVLVFPDLNAGNIGYKLAERVGGATAIGPLLQGLRRPANDLSRGCSMEDVLCAIAVTALQGGD